MAYVLKTDFLKDAPLKRTNGKRTAKLLGFCIHDAATLTHARNLAIYLNYNSPEVSAHFAVDEAEVYQCLPLDYTCWCAGTALGNNQYINIEMARDMDYSSDDYKKTQENCALLVATLAKELGIELNDTSLKRHYDFNGKECPHRMFEAERGKAKGRTWAQFKQLAKDAAGVTPTPTPEPTPPMNEVIRFAKGTVIYPEPPMIIETAGPYTIVEKRNGYGKLKSGAGWVKLPE